MRGQRGRLPVQPLGYVMSTKVIFRRVEVFRDVRMQVNLGLMLKEKQRFHVMADEVDLTFVHADVSRDRLPLEQRLSLI